MAHFSPHKSTRPRRFWEMKPWNFAYVSYEPLAKDAICFFAWILGFFSQIRSIKIKIKRTSYLAKTHTRIVRYRLDRDSQNVCKSSRPSISQEGRGLLALYKFIAWTSSQGIWNDNSFFVRLVCLSSSCLTPPCLFCRRCYTYLVHVCSLQATPSDWRPYRDAYR